MKDKHEQLHVEQVDWVLQIDVPPAAFEGLPRNVVPEDLLQGLTAAEVAGLLEFLENSPAFVIQ